MTDNNEIQILEKKIQELIQEKDNLETQKTKLEKQLQITHERLKKLYDGWRVPGKITIAKQALEKKRLELSDSKLPLAIWLHNPHRKDYVISRVTPKRIYIKCPGSTHEEYYSRETGQRDRWSGTLDVEKCLKAVENLSKK